MTTVLNTKLSKVENKIPETSSLVTTAVLNTKFSEVKNKIPDRAKYITTQEFNKLTAKNFTAKIKKAVLVTKTDFDNKLTSFNKRITSNKTKHFFLGRIYFISNDESQNTFIYQPALDT